MSVYYDPMIAKVIATAETRALAIARLTAALREFADRRRPDELPFLMRILELAAFRDGAIDTGFLDREGAWRCAAGQRVDRRRQSANRNRNPQTQRVGNASNPLAAD